MPDLDRLPQELEKALSGVLFRRHRRLALPLLTTDPSGAPRAALLTLGEVRALSPKELAVAVRTDSRTAFNLVRRRRATLLYLDRGTAASIEARAGRGRTSSCDPSRCVFPLTVMRVRLDRPDLAEGDVTLLAGPSFTGADAGGLFSAEIFEELADSEAR